jgi:multidrug efflux pump subunit AcrA (membrane-fusion protein)
VVELEPGRYEERPVTIDSVTETQVTIREGVATGERLVLSPSSLNHLAAGDTSAGGA